MKNSLLIAAIPVLAFSNVSSAGLYSPTNVGLRAPTVYGKSNVRYEEYGDIILDTLDHTFYGYNDDIGWVPFNGSGTASVSTVSPNALINAGLSVTANAGTITVNLKQNDGSSEPGSGTGAVRIAFRDVPSTNGAYVLRSVTSTTSLTLSGSTTLGVVNGLPTYVYIYAFDNGGTITLGASQNLYDEGLVQTSSTTTNSNQVIYQQTSLSGKAIRLIGRFLAINTSSSWASPTEVSLATQFPSTQTVSVSATQNFGSGSISGATLKWTSNIDQTHGAYDGSTGVFTAPVGGRYRVDALVPWFSTADAQVVLSLQKNGSGADSVFKVRSNATNTTANSIVSRTIKLQAGDNIRINIGLDTGSPNYLNYADSSTLSIYRIGS